jgi:cell division protein FtsB
VELIVNRRWLPLLLLLVLLYLQAQLWFGQGSREEDNTLEREIAEQKAENEKLAQRNQRLRDDVHNLKTDNASIESRARSELGLVKKGETYYLIIEDSPPSSPNSQSNKAARQHRE